LTLRWNDEQYADFLARAAARTDQVPVAAPKKAKYGNHKVVTEEGTFDSKWEYDCWCKLKMQERAGLISGLQRQVPFELIPAATLDTRKLPAVKYIADFVYFRDGEQVVEDAKGMKSLPDYKIKRRLMWWIHKIKVIEIRRK
jgi:hypothetical protein